jgi:D-glucuronyl C5-epimerase-like protein
MRIPILSILALLAVAAPASASQVLEYQPDGRLVPKQNPYLLPPQGPELVEAPGLAPAPASPKVRAARGPSVKSAIATARRRKQISAASARRYLRIYSAARHARSRVSGRNRSELSSVISVLEGMAAHRRLTGSRMPALFLQLSRNRAFWRGYRGVSAGARVAFKGSPVVFQYYPGQGLQFQPLANFGMANGMITKCRRRPKACDRPGIKRLLDDLVGLRSKRGNFVTWEYYFHFGGGTPPWTSGMSSATAIQALARGSARSILNDRSYLRVARRALGVFKRRPPVGVRIRSGRGAHYLIYSFAPRERVLNAFLQSIIGLFDYAKVADDRAARALWKAGDRAARRELPRYDTGSWSRYSMGGPPASREYHQLTTDFLDKLCYHLGGTYCKYYKRFRSYLGKKPKARTSDAAARRR